MRGRQRAACTAGGRQVKTPGFCLLKPSMSRILGAHGSDEDRHKLDKKCRSWGVRRINFAFLRDFQGICAAVWRTESVAGGEEGKRQVYPRKKVEIHGETMVEETTANVAAEGVLTTFMSCNGTLGLVTFRRSLRDGGTPAPAALCEQQGMGFKSEATSNGGRRSGGKSVAEGSTPGQY